MKLMRLSSIVLALLVSGWSASSHGQVTFPVSAPVFTPGDSWTTKSIDAWLEKDLVSRRITFVRRENDNLHFAVSNLTTGVTGQLVTDLNLNACRALRQSSVTSCNGHLQFPITEGLKRRYANMVGLYGTEVYEGQCHAVGVETVVVPAGTFDTVRIDCEGLWTHTFHDSGTGRYEVSLWYSPTARWLVKTLLVRRQGYFGKYQISPDFKTMTVLESYSLNAPTLEDKDQGKDPPPPAK